jgi:hypothetical protein
MTWDWSHGLCVSSKARAKRLLNWTFSLSLEKQEEREEEDFLQFIIWQYLFRLMSSFCHFEWKLFQIEFYLFSLRREHCEGENDTTIFKKKKKNKMKWEKTEFFPAKKMRSQKFRGRKFCHRIWWMDKVLTSYVWNQETSPCWLNK